MLEELTDASTVGVRHTQSSYPVNKLVNSHSASLPFMIPCSIPSSSRSLIRGAAEAPESSGTGHTVVQTVPDETLPQIEQAPLVLQDPPNLQEQMEIDLDEPLVQGDPPVQPEQPEPLATPDAQLPPLLRRSEMNKRLPTKYDKYVMLGKSFELVPDSYSCFVLQTVRSIDEKCDPIF
ncbi:hypothetical protein BVC80_1405g8 [Macleaya cordata]|uniref:Uncharacterized protein n=1 Tax=Macleaya cordata TaxID=56857 RepID=A0A200QEG2_MACCD|nr:hypothetical protein BVC80_1405g8 [Macleaya cordata]